jgi:hypothetical protein
MGGMADGGVGTDETTFDGVDAGGDGAASAVGM